MIGLSDIRNLLSNSISSSARKVMDVNPHFIPLNIKALNASLGSIIQKPNVSLPDINLSKFRTKIITFLKGRYKNYIILAGGRRIIVNGKPDVPIDIIVNRFTPAIVYMGHQSSDAIVGVLYPNFQSASNDLLNEYLNKEVIDFLNKSLGSTTAQFDLGYILKSDSEATQQEQSLGTKLRTLFGILNSFSQNTVTVEDSNVANDKTSVIQTKILVESLLESYGRFKKSGPIVHASIDKNVADFIKRIRADVIIIQDQFENTNIASEIVSQSGFKKLTNMLANTVISTSSFLDDIKNSIISKFTGKKLKIKNKERANIQTIDLRKSSKVNVSTKNNGITSKFAVPKPQMSLVSLQNLLNDGLARQIKLNMGDGSETTVLNYRTGRLANSFKVTALSQERSGAITAFFTYMKYPYITFGPGGAQQQPRSRDPRLLGDKSIRELAVNKISTRLRTVLI